MANSVTVGTSSVGRGPTHGSFEQVLVTFVTGDGDQAGLASDTISLSGAIHEVITSPGSGSTYPSDSYVVKLRDLVDPEIDYLCGTVTGHSDVVTYTETLVSSVTPPVVAGEVQFWVSDASNTSDAVGYTRIMLKS